MKLRQSRLNLCFAAASVLFAAASQAQNAPGNPSNSSQTGLEEVVVTGSRIPTVISDITPDVTVISSQDIEDRGFKNAFDALYNLPQNTGFTQGADYGNTFTPAANTISLRGLGPNHTLVLINGQRVADYPIAYNGAVNFVNLADIPSAAIDRIEILNGGASAIYGSDAIAGVVNIILKDHADGLDVNLKGGTTDHGGGANGRFQATGGETFDRLSTVFALEISRVEPIWAEGRDFMASTTSQGAPPYPVWSRQDLTTGNYITPPGNCAPFAGEFQNSTALYSTSTGSFCGSGKTLPAYWTTQTGNQGENLYGSLKYDVDSHTRLFGNVLLGWNHIWNNTRGPTWTSDYATTGYFVNQNTGDYETWSRSFSPEEIGGVNRFDQVWNDFSGILTAGITGDIGSTGWKYTGTYSGSLYTSHNTQPLLLATVDGYFLGPQLGVDSSGVPIYSPNTARFNQPLTPGQFDSLVGSAYSVNNSWLQTFSLNANGKLFDLPAGPLSAAAVAEWGTQGFAQHPDPRLNQGVFYDTGGDDPASGARSRYAGALEFSAPILSNLNAKLAGRYDEYSFADQSKGKPTYNASIDYRPVELVRIHGSYATSFRAPDMNYIFQPKSLGYFSSTTDYYRCAIANLPLATCPYNNYSPGANYTQLGSKNLGFENGRSFDYGVVLAPIKQVELSIDYWNLRIDNEVTLIDTDMLLRTDSACLLGQLNPNSAECQQAFDLVQRNPPNAVLNPNQITNITIYPINAAFERTDGIDVGAQFRWELNGIGNFLWKNTWTRVMSHYYQQGPGQPVYDLVRSFDNPNDTPDFPDKLASTLSWSLRDFSATVEADRYGEVINSALTGFLTPTTLVNLSVQYKLRNATFGVIVNNLFDTVKMDNSFGWPFYPASYFSPYGRQLWVEFNYHFGA
jgi:iron complex outermembrane receptor protein